MTEDRIDKLASAGTAICLGAVATLIGVGFSWVFYGDPSRVSVWFVFALLVGHLYSDLRDRRQ